MAPTTRRHLLSAAAVTLAAGLAGCDASGGAESETPPEPDRPPNVERDPEYATVRSGGDDALFWRASESTENDSGTEFPPQHSRGRELIADAEAADDVRFADVEGAADARQFVEETDFDEATLYVESRGVEACRALRLCYVTWSRDEIDTRYGGFYRDADVECEADERHRTAVLMRIPDVLDPDEVRSHGSGYHSSGCPPPHWEMDDRTESTPRDVGPVTDDGATPTAGKTEDGSTDEETPTDDG